MGTSDARAREQVERAADNAADVTRLFGDVATALSRAVPLDGWCGHTLDPATSLVTGGDARRGFLPELVPRLLEIEYVEGDVNAFDELVRRPVPVGTIHEATGGDPQASPRYRDVVVPSGLEHELRLVFRHQGRPWGALVLLRAADSPAFSPAEADFVGSLSTSLAQAVKRLLLQGYIASEGARRSGLVILDPHGDIDTVTPDAQRWLDGLRDHEGDVPLPVRAIASQVLDTPEGAARGRARDRSGTWVTLTAWALDGRIAVSMEPCAPHDLVALALEVHSLSERERQVVELVLLGHSTTEIGRTLHLSPYTVQDHLKSVFDKTGTRSRRELAAQLFYRHYLPRIERGSGLNPDGWFAQGG